MSREEIHARFCELVRILKVDHGISQVQIAEHPDVIPAIDAVIPHGNETRPVDKLRQWMKEAPSSWPPETIVKAIEYAYAAQFVNGPYQAPSVTDDRQVLSDLVDKWRYRYYILLERYNATLEENNQLLRSRPRCGIRRRNIDDNLPF